MLVVAQTNGLYSHTCHLRGIRQGVLRIEIGSQHRQGLMSTRGSRFTYYVTVITWKFLLQLDGNWRVGVFEPVLRHPVLGTEDISTSDCTILRILSCQVTSALCSRPEPDTNHAVPARIAPEHILLVAGEVATCWLYPAPGQIRPATMPACPLLRKQYVIYYSSSLVIFILIYICLCIPCILFVIFCILTALGPLRDITRPRGQSHCWHDDDGYRACLLMRASVSNHMFILHAMPVRLYHPPGGPCHHNTTRLHY
ncbi:hypothetical protein F5Y17DRAFT_362148 [Xylariaceae sp. FL0594]|nr:hypothetical protein F5Y17DRAFT_362148 [Xylariaceae sp. FL0594]